MTAVLAVIRMHIFFWVLIEGFLAVFRTKIVCLPLILAAADGIFGLDLHPTHWVFYQHFDLLRVHARPEMRRGD
jgi:hypothetical protein